MKLDPVQGRVVIAGGSGFLGLNLARYLQKQGTEVVILSRSRPTVKGGGEIGHLTWDARSLGDWTDCLEGATALVNLAGRTVDCIKSPGHCDEILRSRVESTLVLGQAMKKVQGPPPVWVQMSSAHIFGDPPEVLCDEDSPPGYGLAPMVATAWEDAFARSALPSQRQVILRTSFVIGRSGGALPKMMTLVRLGLGGRAGHGRQGISWLHEEDMNRLFHRAIVDPGMRGRYVATAPNPVSNAEFMATLRRVLRVPLGLPAPAWLLRFGAHYFMRTDPDLLLCGRYCRSKRLAREDFSYPDLEEALRDLGGRTRAKNEPAATR